MSIRNNHWYNLNELRSYPLDDAASCVSTAGEYLPSTILQDLRIRWPDYLGRYAFVSAVSVTPYLVSVLIEATDDLTSGTGSTLIAGVTTPLADFESGQALRLQAFHDNVGGFISFGNFEGLTFSGLFSGPASGLIAARAGRAYALPPVTSIRVENASTKLSGIVDITAEEPLKLAKESRVIDGVLYDNVLVIRLTQEISEVDVEETVNESVFQQYTGQCGKRVGSRSCGHPTPLETINGVAPDCDGKITLEIRGCATVGKNDETCGVIIDCVTGLTTTCEAPFLPDLSDGRLPGETTTILQPPPLPPEPPVIEDNIVDDAITTILALPYCDTFDFDTSLWQTLTGVSWEAILDDSPEEQDCCDNSDGQVGCSESASLSESISDSAGYSVDKYYGLTPRDVSNIARSYGVTGISSEANRNFLQFNGDVQTLYRRYTTDLKILTPSGGGSRKAGLFLNYQIDSNLSLPVFYHATLDINTNTYGLYFFNGTQDIRLAYGDVPDLRENDWYRISFGLVPSTTGTQLNFSLSLRGITDTTLSLDLNTAVSSNSWLPDSGKAGLLTNRSRAYFSYFRIDEET